MATITLPNNPGLIQNGQVTDATKIMENFAAILAQCNGSLDADNLAALAVTAAKLATDAVETLKIKDANVTLAKMAAESIDSDQYVDGSIDRVHLAADIVDGTKIDDDVVDSEHIVAGAIDLEHMAAESVDSDQYVDGSIDSEHLAADCQAPTVKDQGGVATNGLKCKVIEIGDWDMDAAANHSVAHGLTLSKIRSVNVLVQNDDQDTFSVLLGGNSGTPSTLQASIQVSAANVVMCRAADGNYDGTGFDDVGGVAGNRGWITIWYEA